MARAGLESQPKAVSGAPVTAGVTGARAPGVDRDDVAMLNKGVRCTLPRTAAAKARPAFVWLSRDGSELYWRFAGPAAGASGKPEQVIPVADISKVGTKGDTLAVVAGGAAQVRLTLGDAAAAREWAGALSRVGKRAAGRGV